jgi:hypothetical protein
LQSTNGDIDSSSKPKVNAAPTLVSTPSLVSVNSKDYLSPCSDSSDSTTSRFQFNGTTTQEKLANNNAIHLKIHSSSDSENSCKTDLLQSEIPKQTPTANANLLDDLNINSPNTNTNGNSINSNKRSLSPNTLNNTHQVPIKKPHKEIHIIEQSSPQQNEELLDTLPLPNSNLRVNQPSLAVVKNSIRVNIGCNKK